MGVILGPPEIYKPTHAAAADESSDSESDSFVDAMVTNFNTTSAVEPPPMGLAVNLSLTYRSTTNPCLDFFFQVLPGSDPEKIRNHLRLAWDHDPLTTLKLICNLRGVRGTGKSDKEGYYTAALWLHGLHPKTLACNLRQIAKFGYFKDFPEILYRLLEGHNVRDKAKREHELRKGRRKLTRRKRRHSRAQDDDDDDEEEKKKRKKVPLTEAQRETRILENQRKHMAEKAAAKLARENKKKEKSRKAILRYQHDPDYRYLHDCISDLFSEFLKKDLESLKQGSSSISLAAKWCPSINSPFDESTLLCESIARKIFPKEEYPEYTGIEDAQYAYRVRDRLRKQVLVPLRSALQLPEVYMGAKNWSSLPYNRVPSLAMKAYEKKFLKHDKERFEGYLEDVKSGKATIAAGARLPHEIIKSVTEDGSKSAVAEAQWRRMVEDLSKKGKLSNCLAICDVSSSCRRGRRRETDVNLVSMALGLLVSELSEEPWKGKLITFSTTPKLRRIKGESLESKVEFMKKMKTGTSADFQKVFDAILEVAEMAKLREDQMIKRVFVFSGMEFNQAFISLSHYDVYSRQWETDYKAIERKFRAKGYENCIPEMVFWNLRDSTCTPVVAKQKGVALVSGRSKNMLKTFLEDEGLINPVAIMESAISGQEYANLAVFD